MCRFLLGAVIGLYFLNKTKKGGVRWHLNIMRTSDIKKNLSTAQELVDKKKEKIKQLKKEIKKLKEQYTKYETTAGGAIYGE